MARSLNKVMLIGNLTRDPELRYTSRGTAVCSFGIATNRYWTPSDGGETKEEAEFHRIVAWQKLAEICAQLLFKGRKVFVDGRLQTRTWTGKDGRERTTTEIVIDNMIVLDSKRKDVESGAVFSTNVPVPAASAGNKPKENLKKEEVKKEKPEKETFEKETPKKEAPKKEEVKADDIPF